MKPNFRLSPSNAKEFINRLNKMLSYTGMVESKSVYTGRKKVYNCLVSFGVKRIVLPVKETITSYLDEDTIEYDSYPSSMPIGKGEGIILRINSDCSDVIYWGQKMKFAPNRITFIGDKDMPFYKKCGNRTIFKISNNIALGKYRNQCDEKAAADYWSDYKLEWNF